MDVSNVVRESFVIQTLALKKLSETFDSKSYEKALDLILASNGKVIVSGVGKSGHIGKKISATLSSTGTPSYFVHSTEALHGDLGVIDRNDVIILISNSGETHEVLRVIPILTKRGNKIISITSNSSSTLSKHSDVTLSFDYEKESCPNNLAPTTSTTLTIAIGDALSAALILAKSFTPDDFSCHHPAGSLGKRLLTKVSDVMETKKLPLVLGVNTIKDTLFSIAANRFGMAAIVSEDGGFMGIVTDGDIRRLLMSSDWGVSSKVSIISIMNSNPITFQGDMMISDAEIIMKKYHAKSVPVLNSNNNVIGIIEIFD